MLYTHHRTMNDFCFSAVEMCLFVHAKFVRTNVNYSTCVLHGPMLNTNTHFTY